MLSTREDKVLSRQEAEGFLSSPIIIEEKVDGANIGISFDEKNKAWVQNRGAFISPPYGGQFARLKDWLPRREDGLREVLGTSRILFGEWCAARHSIFYDRLPDWFLAFDLYDVEAGCFFGRNSLEAALSPSPISIIRRVAHGTYSMQILCEMLEAAASAYREGPVEGFVLKRDSNPSSSERCKLVRPEFRQGMGEHWRRKKIELNRLMHGA